MRPVETPHLRLRLLEPRDAAGFARYRSEPDVARYQSWETMSVEEAQELIRSLPRDFPAGLEEWFQLAIADKATDEILGDIGICLRSPDAAEIGFTLAPDAQRKGIATEACRAAIDLLFRSTEVVTVEAVVDRRNVAAIALVQRLGMSLDCTEAAEFKGAMCEEHHFLLHR